MTKRDLGIYVHIPFCARKCGYCDFVSAVGTKEEQTYYIRMLLREIRSFEALGSLYRVRTLFLGGGTPSLLEPMELLRVITQIEEEFEMDEEAEITIECNPGTLTKEKLEDYRRLGINRLSLGLQSANNRELKQLGRIHSWQDFLDSFSLARKIGFDNINVDLMFGIPTQTMESWTDTLEKVTELNPEHISAYSLMIEEGTPFYEIFSNPRNRRLLPDEKTEREMYHFTRKFLDERGYHRYEISNYAKEGRECRHNITYWDGGEYLGFGVSAASYLDGRRFANSDNMEEYRENARQSYANFRKTPPQPVKNTVEEFMFLGLRMMRGISITEFEQKFHVPFHEVYGEQVENMIRQGFLEEEGGRLRFTERGIDVSNSLLVDFLLED